jgi:hypothetical protein
MVTEYCACAFIGRTITDAMAQSSIKTNVKTRISFILIFSSPAALPLSSKKSSAPILLHFAYTICGRAA